MQSLKIQIKITGKGSIETAYIVNNIGLVYDDQGNYSKALQYFMITLEIQ